MRYLYNFCLYSLILYLYYAFKYNLLILILSSKNFESYACPGHRGRSGSDKSGGVCQKSDGKASKVN